MIRIEFPPNFLLFLVGPNLTSQQHDFPIVQLNCQDLSLRTNIPLDELKRHLMSLYVNPKAGGFAEEICGDCRGWVDCCVVMSHVENKKEEIHGAFVGMWWSNM